MKARKRAGTVGKVLGCALLLMESPADMQSVYF